MTSTAMSGAGRPASTGGGLRRTLREKVAPKVRDFADAAVTPLSLDDVLDHFHPLRGGSELRGRVVRVTPETPRSATVLIKPGRGWTGHVPGQFVRLGVDVDGVRLWRSYSLTHGPRPDGLISITVKLVPGGAVSTHLVRRVKPGTLVHLGTAEGEFVMPDPMPAKLLLVTAGSGITPVIGMLRNLFHKAEKPDVDIVLIHSALARAEVIFGREIRGYAEAGLIRLVELHTDSRGRLDVAELDQLVPDLDERPTYACGPVGLLDSLETHHAERGLELFVERFRPVLLAEPGEGGTVTFTETGTDVEVQGDSTILDASEAAGVLMPSGCRMGICMSCVLPLKEGTVRDLRNGELTHAVPGETHPDGVTVQTCVTSAAGPCTFTH
ncbi:ferredoxin reductase [Nocardioides bruguierae]|uniref:Ferredoxin reductase n=1 Tax=Nocardioides bruguierae TaxID=2945102 RepID=A0A9X2D784_9ACTN|nr:ferredoxin reductase [Nocardioides bruguierae]MCM0620314.1 ferredoxin reductase [Nocardioides bruguierae]